MGAVVAKLLGHEDDLLANTCCDVKLVIIASKYLEAQLVTDFGATGRGLHEKITTAEGLDAQTQRRLRKIATIRNKLIHEIGYDEVDDRERFREDFNRAVETLRQKAAERRGETDPQCAGGDEVLAPTLADVHLFDPEHLTYEDLGSSMAYAVFEEGEEKEKEKRRSSPNPSPDPKASNETTDTHSVESAAVSFEGALKGF
ncbi:Hypothetical Protein FCC1311_104762 [Hondaea fermentalgiana]|uniref:DUF4145 domain-containing protein n=1 Tax=Hondaea fermentalgiana TaxID=2315210 RepID=A0A2R5GTR5_9STRA|nr:Hypothetical Protein FCC1311_104762 [Hondaea fermentalgiana]|eukprot:GBG34252.1 Hypothetical Protein FCC1311_104762 [Hondaea fermentalgiana]